MWHFGCRMPVTYLISSAFIELTRGFGFVSFVVGWNNTLNVDARLLVRNIESRKLSLETLHTHTQLQKGDILKWVRSRFEERSAENELTWFSKFDPRVPELSMLVCGAVSKVEVDPICCDPSLNVEISETTAGCVETTAVCAGTEPWPAESACFKPNSWLIRSSENIWKLCFKCNAFDSQQLCGPVLDLVFEQNLGNLSWFAQSSGTTAMRGLRFTHTIIILLRDKTPALFVASRHGTPWLLTYCNGRFDHFEFL